MKRTLAHVQDTNHIEILVQSSLFIFFGFAWETVKRLRLSINDIFLRNFRRERKSRSQQVNISTGADLGGELFHLTF